MEGIWGMILNMENGRMLALAVLGYLGYMKLNDRIKDGDRLLEKKLDGLDRKIDGVAASLNKRIDGVEASLNNRIDLFERKIDSVETSLDKKIDEKLVAFHALLKTNDFAHLNSTIEALTFTLEKNGFLKREDKEYIDTRLDK